ncbi:hypothetical protein Avbf_16333 [Armadillidium vulgare]|nr:hypothetical protein Avbf_16333 [Armadillidium vulgare]
MKAFSLLLILFGMLVKINESNSSCENCFSIYEECITRFCVEDEECLAGCYGCEGLVCPCECATCNLEQFRKCLLAYRKVANIFSNVYIIFRDALLRI